MRLKIILLILASGASLSACQTMQDLMEDFGDLSRGTADYQVSAPAINAPQYVDKLLESPCPQVELVDDLSSISDFTDPKQTIHANLISRVDLSSAESTCKLSSNSAIVDLKLFFNGTLGPKGKVKSSDKPFFSYPYFVAVTAPGGKIMAKEIFAAPLSYSSGENTHVYFENLRQIIPIRSKEMANQYKILIGFQVSPEQLSYNRANMIPVANVQAAENPPPQE